MILYTNGVWMMKDTFIRSVIHDMAGILDSRQLEKLKEALNRLKVFIEKKEIIG